MLPKQSPFAYLSACVPTSLTLLNQRGALSTPDYTTQALKMTNTSATTNTASRLKQVSGHIAAGSSSSDMEETTFPANVVPQAPEDPLFGLMAAYRQDSFDKKVDLGIGAYRDDNAKPWILPVVKKVSDCLEIRR